MPQLPYLLCLYVGVFGLLVFLLLSSHKDIGSYPFGMLGLPLTPIFGLSPPQFKGQFLLFLLLPLDLGPLYPLCLGSSQHLLRSILTDTICPSFSQDLLSTTTFPPLYLLHVPHFCLILSCDSLGSLLIGLQNYSFVPFYLLDFFVSIFDLCVSLCCISQNHQHPFVLVLSPTPQIFLKGTLRSDDHVHDNVCT